MNKPQIIALFAIFIILNIVIWLLVVSGKQPPSRKCDASWNDRVKADTYRACNGKLASFKDNQAGLEFKCK